jgi:single-strand DNA-binding protein
MEAWDTGAETIYKNFRKGDKILTYASVKTDRWTDAEGKQRSKLKFRVDRFEFLNNPNRHLETKTEDTEEQVEL